MIHLPWRPSRLEQFTVALSKLEAIEFLGVCRALDVPLTETNTDQPREFRALIYDVVARYPQLSPKNQRQLLKLVRQAGRAKETC